MHQTEQITVAQAARILGCSRWTVVRMLTGDTPQLPATKSGNGTAPWLIDRAAVEALAAQDAA